MLLTPYKFAAPASATTALKLVCHVASAGSLGK
nr:MAG TPA_asm: hypothetical protein [Caudoviricetes sp.]